MDTGEGLEDSSRPESTSRTRTKPNHLPCAPMLAQWLTSFFYILSIPLVGPSPPGKAYAIILVPLTCPMSAVSGLGEE